jgi:hypothetical protein
MKVKISESFFYEAWTVSSDFGTSTSYRIYVKVLDPGTGKPGQPYYRPMNLFANKHWGQDADTILKMRRCQGVSESAKWDALERLGVKLKTNLSPEKLPPANTVIDFKKIDRKYAAYLIAKALFEGMMSAKFGDYQNTKESKYIEKFEVDFGIQCVVSAGGKSDAPVNKILIGVKRVSKLNPQNWVSFEVNHCAGGVSE